jgi:antitoxin PrlF
MTEFESSVSPKGQITIPLELRRRWGIKARDRVAFLVDEQTVTLVPVRSPVDESFGAVPPLERPLTVEEMTEIAAEEHAQEAARAGLPSS